ncbi:uroporphyrinogen decarboxylase family protein [Pseudoflavonifractor capillosus]|uniref:Thioredoxin family protein n=1 Tax=Pseudoflavonifractor capillosus TaxID=106588 RepID=A0A921STR8_9FIRM|nr:uroporphyrinogen decarboxylase family protein [Pseudoflavonifractor capillosus]HJG87577.1 thioredoxin family protein [Pseudoflavonifractor capillosus]
MTPKELLFAALRHEKTPRAPWVPFAGVHAGRLIGADATQVLTDEDTLVKSLLEVNRLYKPDGQPVVFDLQLEAEILGCELVWAKDAPPSVSSHPLADTMTVPCRCTLPRPDQGRLPIVLNAMRRMKKEVGDTTALYGLICGPFTLASHLRGNDLFMDMYDDEDYVAELLEYCMECAKRMTDYFVDAGMDVIAVVDPLVSQISSAHFTDFLSSPYTALFDYIRAKGVFSSFFVCGNATRSIEAMCQTNPDSISVDENVDIIAAKAVTDKYNVAIGGNIPLTSVMLHGTQQDNMKYVVDLLEKLPEYRNFIVAPGCDMPYAVPVENAIGVAQAALETESVRKMVENYVSETFDMDVELPDYEHLTRPLVEVCTLDSATCAACTYMMGAATVAKEQFGDAIDMVEYKFTVKENIARFVKMGVKSLPSIYINGKLKFASIIPSKEELEQAIRKVL